MKKTCCKEAKMLKLQAGQLYFWCQCGYTNTQPFCDGTHKGSGIKSLRFTPERDQEVMVCTCQKTKTPPYCDGTLIKE